MTYQNPHAKIPRPQKILRFKFRFCPKSLIAPQMAAIASAVFPSYLPPPVFCLTTVVPSKVLYNFAIYRMQIGAKVRKWQARLENSALWPN